MSARYTVSSIYDFITRNYGLRANVSQIKPNHIKFDLGNIGAFILNMNAFNNEADLVAFKLDLSERLNVALSA